MAESAARSHLAPGPAGRDRRGEARTPELVLLILSLEGDRINQIPWGSVYRVLYLSPAPNQDALLLQFSTATSGWLQTPELISSSGSRVVSWSS